MLQETITFDMPGHRAGGRGPGSAADIAAGIVAALHRLGVDTMLIKSASGTTAGGADLQAKPAELERSHTATEHFLRRLAGLVQEGIPVTISLKELGPGDMAIDALERFCLTTRKALDGDTTLMKSVSLSLRSHQLPLEAYLLVSRALLGDGGRYVLLDSLQMQHHAHARVQEATERNWLFLWQQRCHEKPLFAAYGACVRSGCPLLADEAAEAVLPLEGLQVPAGSAWLPIGLHLPRFADERGQIIWEELGPALEGCVDHGEQLLDVLSWMTPCQRSDAWLNRRIAVVVTGIGDLVRVRDDDPASLECLRSVEAIVARIRKTLWDRSHAIAGQTGVLPALARSDPSGGFCDHSHRSNWQRRWRHALASSAVRHRNLLAMSPYSLLPTAAEDSGAFTDLLPLLRHADAYAFGASAPLDGWNITQFRRFHTRAWAVMQRRNARSLVADGV